MHYRITLQHCLEKLLLLMVITAGIWKLLSILIDIARSGLMGNIITFYSYRSESMTIAIMCYAVICLLVTVYLQYIHFFYQNCPFKGSGKL
jgi:hypothetical protein